MIEELLAADGASLVVIAPHPDDESIAAGGLIQLALRLRARVTVVLLTDGDNNPWPQRAVERRIWIGARDRERWGRRRREEARSALTILGVPEGSVHCVGWPDLGMTHLLETDCAATVGLLRDVFRNVAPTVIVTPSLHDRHPDHSAAHVMCCLALAECDSRPQLLSYTIHGTENRPFAECALDDQMREQKIRAISAYRTQLALSGPRIMGYAKRAERFVAESTDSTRAMASRERLPWRVSTVSAMLSELVCVVDNQAWRVAIESNSWPEGQGDSPRCVRDSDGELWLRFPIQRHVASPVFVKLRGRIRSPWIYDRWHWVRLGG